MTPQYLRKYILSPHEVKPGSTMPDLFHASEAQAKAGAAEYITEYLVSLGGPIKPARKTGTPCWWNRAESCSRAWGAWRVMRWKRRGR